MPDAVAPQLQRRRARKTALVLALVALAVYAAFFFKHFV